MTTSDDQPTTRSPVPASSQNDPLLANLDQAGDYFSFFGLPRKLNLDTSALERHFYRLSRRLHPDLYARAGAQEQQWSLQKTSQLNDAYRTLKDPVARTQYLLRLEGVPWEEQSQAASEQARQTGGPKKQAVPPELLEEVFELNMQLEELRERNAGDGSSRSGPDPELSRELEVARDSFQEKLEAADSEIQACWREWDALPDNPDAARRRAVLDKMLGLLNRRTYIRNLVRDVNEALQGW